LREGGDFLFFEIIFIVWNKIMNNKSDKIISTDDYEKYMIIIENLMNRDEASLSKDEIALLRKLAEHAGDYEDASGMTPIPRSKELAQENDRNKIAAVLGYEPDLIGLVEFKMYQLKMNQNGLAEEVLKMPASKISQILNKKREPDIHFLKGIHEKLGIDGNYILEAV
jgi:HTH-type transcriptional regulator / antitoxin HigA